MTPSCGIHSLATDEEAEVAASESEPVAVEVLSGRIEAEGELSAGETVTLTAPAPITALTDATIEVRDQDDEED